ncbi:PDZ domain-containing protein 9-like [Amia ocellicauda]|uniref:PDZ domain-containing protein 9-like n=1 Tax=Amia ocellicauda TaxID=2972642 RepID=UPI0034647191
MGFDGLGFSTIKNEHFLQIYRIRNSSSASRDGVLQPGDVLAEVGPVDVLGMGPSELRKMLEDVLPGRFLRIRVYRNYLPLPQKWTPGPGAQHKAVRVAPLCSLEEDQMECDGKLQEWQRYFSRRAHGQAGTPGSPTIPQPSPLTHSTGLPAHQQPAWAMQLAVGSGVHSQPHQAVPPESTLPCALPPLFDSTNAPSSHNPQPSSSTPPCCSSFSYKTLSSSCSSLSSSSSGLYPPLLLSRSTECLLPNSSTD